MLKCLAQPGKTLFRRQFIYINSNGNLVTSRWIGQVEYLKDDGAIKIWFTPCVVEGIRRIDGVEQFFYLLPVRVNSHHEK